MAVNTTMTSNPSTASANVPNVARQSERSFGVGCVKLAISTRSGGLYGLEE